jgi:hypothetical protein
MSCAAQITSSARPSLGVGLRAVSSGTDMVPSTLRRKVRDVLGADARHERHTLLTKILRTTPGADE